MSSVHQFCLRSQGPPLKVEPDSGRSEFFGHQTVDRVEPVPWHGGNVFRWPQSHRHVVRPETPHIYTLGRRLHGVGKVCEVKPKSHWVFTRGWFGSPGVSFLWLFGCQAKSKSSGLRSSTCCSATSAYASGMPVLIGICPETEENVHMRNNHLCGVQPI